MNKLFLATIDTTSKFTIGEGLVRIGLIVFVIVCVYVFGRSFLGRVGSSSKKARKKVANNMAGVNYSFQRYVYLHPKSPMSKLYWWVNSQLVASGLKRGGITPAGYIIFWVFMSAVASVVIKIVLNMGLGWVMFLTLAFFIMSLILTRVAVASKLETRENAVMNAVDLIVPEITNGVKNAIAQYKDNFDPLVQYEFQEFLTNIQDRGMSFEQSMIILSDSLGPVFRDFARKAIYFEESGEQMAEVFADITETNRLRRQIREENNATFVGLKTQFVVSSLLCGGYFIFLMITDDFSREFFLESTGGNLLLICIIAVIFLVLSYITTIKSRAL